MAGVSMAGHLAELVRSSTDRDRLWIAERGERIVGCIAIVGASEREAQLRWFLVDPSARVLGLGMKLLREAVAFCKSSGYETVFLWTVIALTAAVRLYRSVGFKKGRACPKRHPLCGSRIVYECGRPCWGSGLPWRARLHVRWPQGWNLPTADRSLREPDIAGCRRVSRKRRKVHTEKFDLTFSGKVHPIPVMQKPLTWICHANAATGLFPCGTCLFYPGR